MADCRQQGDVSSGDRLSLICIVFSMKKGRVVILLAGRQAGKKAIIIKQNDEGKKVIQIHFSKHLNFRAANSPTLS